MPSVVLFFLPPFVWVWTGWAWSFFLVFTESRIAVTNDRIKSSYDFIKKSTVDFKETQLATFGIKLARQFPSSCKRIRTSTRCNHELLCFSLIVRNSWSSLETLEFVLLLLQVRLLSGRVEFYLFDYFEFEWILCIFNSSYRQRSSSKSRNWINFCL